MSLGGWGVLIFFPRGPQIARGQPSGRAPGSQPPAPRPVGRPPHPWPGRGNLAYGFSKGPGPLGPQVARARHCAGPAALFLKKRSTFFSPPVNGPASEASAAALLVEMSADGIFNLAQFQNRPFSNSALLEKGLFFLI